MDGYSVGSVECGCGEKFHIPRFIALTGGPGAGKTAVLELAKRSFCQHVAILPEAAGIVFGGGFPRHANDPARVAAQVAIYHVQIALEGLVAGERQVGVALCDRGTLDGYAYWPHDEASYFEQTCTTREKEFARYAAVIHLRTPGVDGGYNNQNSLRIETAAEAQAVDERIAQSWSGHPKVVTIASAADFLEKARTALEVVRRELPSCCLRHQLP